MDNPKILYKQLASQSSDLFFFYDYKKQHFECLSDEALAFLELPSPGQFSPGQSSPGQSSLGLSREEIKQQPGRLLELVSENDKQYVSAIIKNIKDRERRLAMQYPSGAVLTKARPAKARPAEARPAKVPPTELPPAEFRIMLGSSIKWMRVKFYESAETEAGAYLLAIAEDISPQKEMEQSLTIMKEQKDIAIQVMGHDLRAPLNTISLSMALMGKQINLEQNKSVRELIEIVERTCRNSLDMIQEVLSAEYLETQQLDPQKSRIDISSRIQNQLDTFRLLDRANKRFVFHKQAESVYAGVDSVRLVLILENLLTNAYKFTPEGGNIEVSLEESETSVLIKVADNGIGIPDSLKPLIFDKFTKARRRGIQGEQTVGLGLHLIKTMVDQLEGRIWFESEEGKGTTFYVELPK